MKKFADNKHIFRRVVILLALAACLSVPACHNANAEANNGNDEASAQRPDDALSRLMKAISEGDAAGFASICTYPVVRTYPLRSIQDSATMVDYFPVMIDDSLIKITAKSQLNDWNFYGWKGWALGDSTILWYDDGLQFVDYESKAETGLRKMFARNEIMSLPPELREGWTPVETLVETDGDKIYRIDSSGGTYRLMEYGNRTELKGSPTLILVGNLNLEGSGDYRVYVFTDSLGTKAEYLPDEEPPVTIDITSPGKEMKSHKVKRGYWRDLLK